MKNIAVSKRNREEGCIEISLETTDHYIDVIQTTNDGYVGKDAEYDVVVRERKYADPIWRCHTGNEQITIEQALAIAFCEIAGMSYNIRDES